MKHTINRILDMPYAIAATATVAMLAPSAAQAQANIGDTAEQINTQLGNVGRLLVAGAVLGGIAMLATGLMKLKQAADTQGNQVKYSEGMWRVAVGAGLVAIPAFSGMLTQTFGFGESATITTGGGQTF